MAPILSGQYVLRLGVCMTRPTHYCMFIANKTRSLVSTVPLSLNAPSVGKGLLTANEIVQYGGKCKYVCLKEPDLDDP